MSAPRVVTLLTDYGTTDSYVAEVKGRLLQAAPGVTIVDITHDVEPGDIAAAAFVLGRAWAAFPAGSVHVAVVDPGVGTARRGLVVESGKHAFVGPDNGVLDAALANSHARAFALPVPEGASATFHGRDVFAPAAVRLVLGEAAALLGEAVDDPVRLGIPDARRDGKYMVGRVIYVDRFGTLVTNIRGDRVAPSGAVRVGAHDIPLHRTFADVATGHALALVGSGGTLEIAVRDGRADSALGLARGAEVRALVKPR